jgi:hypothetical protein
VGSDSGCPTKVVRHKKRRSSVVSGDPVPPFLSRNPLFASTSLALCRDRENPRFGMVKIDCKCQGLLSIGISPPGAAARRVALLAQACGAAMGANHDTPARELEDGVGAEISYR